MNSQEIIKYCRSKIVIFKKAHDEIQQKIDEVHDWWNKGFLKPSEVDNCFTDDGLTFEELQDIVSSRMQTYYSDYLIETPDDYFPYDDFYYWWHRIYEPYFYGIWDLPPYEGYEVSSISEDYYWNGGIVTIIDEETEEIIDEILVDKGTYYWLISVRNRRWYDYGEINVPW